MELINKRNNGLIVLLLCWVAYSVSYLGRMNLAIAIPAMEAEGVASLSQLGIAGSLYFWCYGCGHLINGALGDRISPKYMIFGGLFLSAIANSGIFFFPQPVFIIIFWSFNGFCLSMLWGPMVRLLGENISEKNQGTVAFLMTMSIGVGSFLSWFVLGALIEKLDNWQYAFSIPAVVCCLFAFLWLLLYPDVVDSQETAPHEEVEQEKKESFFSIFIRTRLYLLIIAAMIQGMIKDGLTLWIPTLMKLRFTDISANIINERLALIPLLNVLGILIIAILLKKEKPNYKYSSILMFIIAAGILFLLFKWQLPITITLLLLGVLSILIAFINSILLSLAPMQFWRTKRISTVAGLLDFVAYLSAGIFSIFSGVYFQNSGEWTQIFLILIIAVLMGACIMIPAKKEIIA